MFRPLRFFAVASTAGLVALAALLWVVHQRAVQQLIGYAEAQNVTLARSFANTILPRFSSYVSSISELSAEKLRDRAEVEEIQKAMKAASVGLPILKVKIYNRDGMTVFSSDRVEIGHDSRSNPSFASAAGKGLPVSRLAHRDQMTSFDGVVQNREVVESYLPIRQDDGRIRGIFELYSDVTALLDRINGSTRQLLIGLLVLFSGLYAALYYLVKRADKTIKRQYANIEDKNKALETARDTLERRVAQRTRKLADEVAERKRAERDLSKLSQAVRQSPAMTMITDLSGAIEYVNPRFVEVTGYAPEEVIGKSPSLLKSGETNGHTYKKLWRLISGGNEWTGEFQNRKKNGDLYWARTTISPVTGGDGAISHYLGISEDVTALKIAEQEKRRQQAELAHAGRVITLGEMATSLAHEINQPLSIIYGAAQMCNKAIGAGRAGKKLLGDPVNQIMQQSQRANDIIRSIRNFAKKGELKEDEIDINDAIGRIANLLESDGRDHGSFVSFDLSENVPRISANMLQMQQVILNLAHNGFEAMMETETGARHLTIRTQILSDGAVGFSVHDTGCGIEAGILEKIFLPFFSSKPDGIGMGLSISRSIVEAHGGRLWPTSSVREGACFHVSLPAACKGAGDEA